MFNQMQKFIEFHMAHFKISQLIGAQNRIPLQIATMMSMIEYDIE